MTLFAPCSILSNETLIKVRPPLMKSANLKYLMGTKDYNFVSNLKRKRLKNLLEKKRLKTRLEEKRLKNWLEDSKRNDWIEKTCVKRLGWNDLGETTWKERLGKNGF